MTSSIKTICIIASFTLFALSTVGLEIEEPQVSCSEELLTQVEVETTP